MIKSYVTDPTFALTVRWALALVFLSAVAHKLKAAAAFRTTLANYRLLPERLLTPTAYSIIVLELVAVAALLSNSRLGSGMASGLLMIYTLAIVINLARGRLDIDCGCSGAAIRQTLSAWLVVRNAGLLAAALVTVPAANPRPLHPLDWFTALAAVATFILIYSAATMLSTATIRPGR